MHKPSYFVLAFAIVAGSVFAADTQRRCFSIREKIFANDEPLGYYSAGVSIETTAGSNVVSFTVKMPDSPQILEVSQVAAKSIGTRSYTFQFVDGWGNKGKGSLVVSGKRATLDLNEEEVAQGGNNILRNYGTHKLLLGHCK
jgi:hypothetical protein